MKRRSAILIAWAAILVLLAPSARGASPLPELPPLLPPHLLAQVGASVPPQRSFRSGFVTGVRGGYRIGVANFGDAVGLVVLHGRRSETIYLARGVATPGRLQATFGNFGRVSMLFHASAGRPARQHGDCRGESRIVRHRGVFVGSLRFRGEGGYVSARLHRARGVVDTIATRCRQRARREPRRSLGSLALFQPTGTLLATSRHGVDSTALLVLGVGHRTALIAKREEDRGKLALVRLALALEPKPLHINDAVTYARVAAPAPFHGQATYRAAPDGTTSWSGDLAVNFPGAPHTPLAGPEFDALLEAPF